VVDPEEALAPEPADRLGLDCRPSSTATRCNSVPEKE